MQALQKQGYNGWTNYETWNVALWIENEEWLYEFAKRCDSYDAFVYYLKECGDKKTPDGVSWFSRKVNRKELTDNVFNWNER